MTALAANQSNRSEKDGKLIAYPLGAAKTVYQGALVVTDGTTGLLEAGTDAASKNFVGIAYESGENGSGAAAAISCRVRKTGTFLFALTGTAVSNAAIGKAAYISDDNTVALAATTTNDVLCGYIVGHESGLVRVRIDRAAN